MVRENDWRAGGKAVVQLFLVRHGKSLMGFDQAEDSPLSPLGFEQAAEAGLRIASALPPMRVLSSPFLRARQSAAPLAARWGRPVELEDAVTEIPVPSFPDLAARRPWLDAIMGESYGALDPRIEQWRRALLGFVAGVGQDCVVFTHYLTINAVVGAVRSDPRVEVCAPDYCAPWRIVVEAGAAVGAAPLP